MAWAVPVMSRGKSWERRSWSTSPSKSRHLIVLPSAWAPAWQSTWRCGWASKAHRCASCLSRHADAFLQKHVTQPDQWQADQTRGVAASGAAKQAHAQAFGLEAAAAVIGLLGQQVALHSRFLEVAKMHGEWHAVDLRRPGGTIE